ncbi:DUF6090 family protein [Winogradskyella vincentii]|uniref:Uncharacterized protein n=1 Tax=Winogradskyella vincentii TaxID=2877122 RepID=A0ABS7Y3C0_9FLAO|nr:DUF6090 family protein [Winogradskyella vincentii]MCA0154413.1 hypothetical protein [Winogradskyella vincentii]
MGKYFKYAIGEIALVMIGILLALQINNWNEARKSSIKEATILNSLRSELMTSLKELKHDYEASQVFHQSTINIYDYIQTKPKLVDSMYSDFYKSVAFNYSFLKTSAYETLKSGNLDLIKSDSLRMLITDIYESGYQRIYKKIDTRRNAARLLFPYYQKHFRSILKGDSISGYKRLGIPNDYDALINDPEYETLIYEARAGRRGAEGELERTINAVENCINQINKYLKE